MLNPTKLCAFAFLAVLSLGCRADVLGTGAIVNDDTSVTIPNISGVYLDDFEHGLRISSPGNSGELRKLWQRYNDGGGGSVASIVTTDYVDGTHSLALPASHSGQDVNQSYFYTNTDSLSGWTNGWKYIYRFVQNWTLASPSGYTWTQNYYNKLRFWVKVPAGYTRATDGSHNFEIGTFLASPEGSGDPDTNNQHYYHEIDLGADNAWIMVIWDMVADHQRGVETITEHNLSQPYSGKNMWDVMDAFYLDWPYVSVAGTTVLWDGFEFYHDPNADNILQVHSLNASYNASTHRFQLGWNRKASEGSITHQVRYAFSDIYTIGFNAATVAPGTSTVTPPGSGNYHGMHYTTTAIDVTGHSFICFAIKPSNATAFSQICIPTTGRTTQ